MLAHLVLFVPNSVLLHFLISSTGNHIITAFIIYWVIYDPYFSSPPVDLFVLWVWHVAGPDNLKSSLCLHLTMHIEQWLQRPTSLYSRPLFASYVSLSYHQIYPQDLPPPIKKFVRTLQCRRAYYRS